MERSSGILCPVSALPSRFGVGDFGKSSRNFIDLLVKAGEKIWQLLPLNPLGYGHSPYQPFSSYAIDEIYMDLDALAERKLIPYVSDFFSNARRVNYEAVRAFKTTYLQTAFKNEMEEDPTCLDAFVVTHPWVKSWSLYMTLKKSERLQSWDKWSPNHRDDALAAHSLTKKEKVAQQYEIWLQKTLYGQWLSLRQYAKANHILLFGDVPFYVGFDSCDVWANKEFFLLDPHTNKPLWIAGVPPDYFSKTGQRWGNPIYDWDRLQKTNFKFLIQRLLGSKELYDIVRLDHFRAFDTYWKVPSSCPTAIEGSWVEAPGYAFFDAFLPQAKGMSIIAEDLGDLRPQVLTLRDHYHFPGMNIVEFTFLDAMRKGVDFKGVSNQVAYIGTHDNDPFVGYYAKLSSEEKSQWNEALSKLNLGMDSPLWNVIAYTLSLKADYAIIALQDILGLGSEARLNVPGVINDVNWTWRLPSYEPLERLLPRLVMLNKKYCR